MLPRRFAFASATLGSIALLSAGTALLGQDHPNHKRGADAATAYAYDQLDAVNLFNGNLTLNLPIGQEYPVGGLLSYALALHYNSNAWEFEEGPGNQWGQPTTTAFPDPHSNAGMGWVLTLGRLHPPLSGRFNTSTSWLLVEPDGTRRQFAPTLHDGEAQVANVFYTRDGSYLRLRKVGSSWEVDSPNGLVRTFDSTGQLTRIRDRMSALASPPGTSNSLWVSYGANKWTLTDNSDYSTGGGRTHEIEFYPTSGDIPQRVKQVKLKTFGGATSTYVFGYDVVAELPRHLDHNSEGLPGGEPATIAAALLTSITLPDGRSFAMQYFVANDYRPTDGIYNVSGVLSSLKLPTRGRYAWEYGPYVFNGALPPPGTWLLKNTGVRHKYVYDPIDGGDTLVGTWTYRHIPPLQGSPSLTDPLKEIRTAVTTPLGDVTVHYFTYDNGPSPVKWCTRVTDRHGVGFRLRLGVESSRLRGGLSRRGRAA